MYLFHTRLAGSLFCNCNKTFECVLHEIAFLFRSGAWIEAQGLGSKQAKLRRLSYLSEGRGGPWFSSLQATSPSSALWPVEVGVCSPCCNVHFCASPVLLMAVVPLPQNRCVCVTLLCPHHVLGWEPTGVSRVSLRAEALYPWPWGCCADHRLMFHDVLYPRPWDHLFSFNFFN